MDYGPKKAIDKDLSTMAVTRFERRAWWRMNLGAAYIVFRVIVFFEEKLVISVLIHALI